MEMLKYLNKKIFKYLCIALIFLIVASFVASSVEEDIFAKDGVGITLTQHPETIRPNETIDFNWNISHKPLSTGEYCFEIKDPNGGVIHEQRITIPSDEVFGGGINIAPDEVFDGGEWRIAEEHTAKYAATLTFPCEDPGPIRAISTTFFEVTETLLIIQKFNDTNQNGRIDGRDERLQRWEFKVTDPDDNTKTYSTEPPMGEKRIVVPEEYAGKSYTIEETLPPGWKPILPRKQTVRVSKGETTTVQFLNQPTETKLIIRKFDDTNRNGRIDGGDERLQGWEFKVTDPGGNTKPYTTTNKREILINVPPEYAGKKYTVEEILQPGWKSILPSKQTVNVPAGRTTTVQFLNAKTLLIIQKFGDSNRNSKIDGNDAKLQGWKFKVTDPGKKTTSYLTNSRGEIIIKVPPEYAEKEYIIEETLLPLWKSVLPIEQPVHVNVLSGKTTSVQFLNKKNETQLIIQKFYDSNRNGEVDSEDERLPDWNFNVTDPAGKTTSHPTDDNGEIIIGVPPTYVDKEYTIEETLQPKWELVFPIEQPVHVKVPMGETKTFQFLNNELITRLRIQKFSDINRNDKIDNNDAIIRDWEFKVTDPTGNTKTYFTNNDDDEIVINVPEEYAGKEYTVEEILKDGWKAITHKKQIIKVPESEITTVQFLNQKNETLLTIQKFQDSNRNNKIDSNDARLQGWEFKVTDPTGNAKTYFTNINGEIIIVVPKKYAGKEYTVEEILKDGWKAITHKKQIIKVPESKITTVQFLNFCETSLTIHKFNDSNQNKVQDLEEQDLAWNFIITFPDGSTKRITTDANGSYTLHDIPVGRYEITEEPRSCLWASSTETTQRVDVEAGKEKKAFFGNYIAECCILPGCVWKNRDKNIEVCKSVNPCNVTLGKEAEVRVHLGLCVDPEHILNGTKVRNISVIDTLHNQFTIVEGSLSEDPNASWSNPDGTTTIRWNISSLCCEEWRVSFNVTATFALPIDVTESYGVSKVIYDDPNIEETKVVKELPIPAGKLLFVLPTPTPTPTTTSSPTPKPPGFEALLAIVGLLAVAYMMWRRKR